MFTGCLLPKRFNVFQHLTVSAWPPPPSPVRHFAELCSTISDGMEMCADLEWVLNIQSCSVRKFARALIRF